MKLSDLNPRWTVANTANFTAVDRHGMGISFDCPIHRNHRLGVMFANPIDGKEPDTTNQFLWTREGKTFDSLTLSPSVDATVECPGCWHGCISNGDVT